jgi:hypothetical protein
LPKSKLFIWNKMFFSSRAFYYHPAISEQKKIVHTLT